MNREATPGSAPKADRSWRSALASIGAALRQARQAHHRRQEVRATYRALNQLSAAELHDIGLDRSQLLSVACEIADGHSEADADERGEHRPAARSRPIRVLPPAILWHAFR